MSIRHISDMVHDQRPAVLRPDSTVLEACQVMRDRRIGAVLVVATGDKVAGIFTGRDAVSRVLAEGRDPASTRLKDVMTPDPCCMEPGKTAIDALRLMQDGGFRHLPVVQFGSVVGIVSRGDFRGQEQARMDEETGIWERI